MKRLTPLIMFIFVCALTATAQRTNYKRPKQLRTSRDSVIYYQVELDQYLKASWDSIRGTETYLDLTQKVRRGLAASPRYLGVMLLGEVLHSDYKAFNRTIAQNGFSPLKPTMARFGIGLVTKKNQRIFEFRFITMGFNNRSKKDKEEIASSLSSVIELVWGYDFIRSPMVDLYPYVGLGGRISGIQYTQDPLVNSSFTDISNIIANDQSVYANSTRLGYVGGIGIDFKLTRKEDTRRSPMFFAKFGVSQPFWNDKYDIEGISYQPGFKQGDWLVSFGFKFLTKTL